MLDSAEDKIWFTVTIRANPSLYSGLPLEKCPDIKITIDRSVSQESYVTM